MEQWRIDLSGKSISCDIKPGESDFIEMSGRGVSFIVTYGAHDDAGLVLCMHPVFPTLRKRPNDTHASFQCDIPYEKRPALSVDGHEIHETAVGASYDGVLRVFTRAGALELTHTLFPATSGARAAFDVVSVTNRGGKPVALSLTRETRRADCSYGVMGIVIAEITASGAVPELLGPDETTRFIYTATGRKAGEEIPETDADSELKGRYDDIERLTEVMQLETGDRVFDTMFRFAKLRAGDSVFDTACGPIHSPGGYSYYGAVWCNDQCEYSGPWFAMTGDARLKEAAMNAYRLYEPFMDDDYVRIPSSVIAEGYDIWDGAGDRGDAAMYLYGGASFALACGDEEKVRRLWPKLKWCAEYCRRRLNAQGVVESDTDELEGRFPSGSANLSTSCLYCGGLRYGAMIAASLGETELSAEYSAEADALEADIERFFGAKIHGYDTYRYYDTCKVLRSWICLPLCVGIEKRAAGTTDALLSDFLAADCGLLTSEENRTLWDRSTLYAIRGIIMSGRADDVWDMLSLYCRKRLLGKHVPYAVEAYPDGNGVQLSGESSLFCRIVTDGLFGIKPTGVNAFTLDPHLPSHIKHASLRNVHAFGKVFDITVTESGADVTFIEE